MQAVSCYPKNVARTIEEKRYRRRTSNMFHIHYWINDAVLETINKVRYTKNKIEILSILPKKHLRDSCTSGKLYRSWCLGGGGSKKQLLTPEVCIVFRASKNHELTTMFASLHPISPNEIKLQVLQADFLISPTTFLWPKVVPPWRMIIWKHPFLVMPGNFWRANSPWKTSEGKGVEVWSHETFQRQRRPFPIYLFS